MLSIVPYLNNSTGHVERSVTTSIPESSSTVASNRGYSPFSLSQLLWTFCLDCGVYCIDSCYKMFFERSRLIVVVHLLYLVEFPILLFTFCLILFLYWHPLPCPFSRLFTSQLTTGTPPLSSTCCTGHVPPPILATVLDIDTSKDQGIKTNKSSILIYCQQ